MQRNLVESRERAQRLIMAGEVLVKMVASGMCHSDEHLVTGDLPANIPVIGGHEGAGIVQEVGPGVTWLQPGDHVIFGFIPSCGKCPSCSNGHQNMCDLGAAMGLGLQIAGALLNLAWGMLVWNQVPSWLFGADMICGWMAGW